MATTGWGVAVVPETGQARVSGGAVCHSDGASGGAGLPAAEVEGEGSGMVAEDVTTLSLSLSLSLLLPPATTLSAVRWG